MIHQYLHQFTTNQAFKDQARHAVWRCRYIKAPTTSSILPFLVFLLLAFPATPFQSITTESRIIPTLHSQRNNNNILKDCPFSRTFPRYRIDLTRSSPPGEKKGINLLRGFQLASLRSRLSKQYDGSVLFVEEQSGVRAFTTLWEAAARLLTGEVLQVVVALPDCDGRVLVNWKEIIDWIHNNMPEEVRIETTLLEDNQVVRMDRVGEKIGTMASTNPLPVVSDNMADGRTKAWVKRLLVDLAICPFTKSVTKSGQGLGDIGVPVGNIAYHTSNSNNVYQLMADTWGAICEMIDAGPSGKDGVSSILLAAPAFDHNFDYWSGPMFTILENCVVAAQAESKIGVVCFHPCYATPDGTSWPGFGHMHSVPRLERWIQEEGHGDCPYSSDDVAAGGAWQRRTPHATINVLRADQLELAESRRNTPQLYARNIKLLMDIGNGKLAEDLERERSMGS